MRRFTVSILVQSIFAISRPRQNRNPVRQVLAAVVGVTIQCKYANRNLTFAIDAAGRFPSAALPYNIGLVCTQLSVIEKWNEANDFVAYTIIEAAQHSQFGTAPVRRSTALSISGKRRMTIGRDGRRNRRRNCGVRKPPMDTTGSARLAWDRFRPRT